MEKDKQDLFDENNLQNDREKAEQGQSDSAACRAALEKSEERVRYLLADFENFRRNTEKERVLWVQSAQARIFTDLLSVIDNFERAIEELKKGTITETERARFQGFELIYRELLNILSRYGVLEISIDGPFNPNYHEALVQVDAEGKASGEIVSVLQKGYVLKETVLRPAKVTVAR